MCFHWVLYRFLQVLQAFAGLSLCYLLGLLPKRFCCDLPKDLQCFRHPRRFDMAWDFDSCLGVGSL